MMASFAELVAVRNKALYHLSAHLIYIKVCGCLSGCTAGRVSHYLRCSPSVCQILLITAKLLSKNLCEPNI